MEQLSSISSKEKKRLLYEALKKLGIVKEPCNNWKVNIGGNHTGILWIEVYKRE